MTTEAGLLRLQQAAWQPICPEAPQLGDTASPDLRQTALLVRAARPALQIRSLEAGRATTAFLPLPDGSKPLGPPAWSSSGDHLALLYETCTTAGRQLSALVVRLSDHATQRAKLENLPISAAKLESANLPILWAPKSATLLVVRGTSQQQQQTCYRRSRLKAVGCELVFHDAKTYLMHSVLWSPNGAYLCHDTGAGSLTIYNIGKGTSAVVKSNVSSPIMCFAPCSQHLLCCGLVACRAQFIDVQLASASQLYDMNINFTGTVNCVAWGCSGQAAITSNCAEEGEGKVALYSVLDGPSLQLLQILTIGGLAEDLTFSPCGTYLAFLDEGSDMGVEPLSIFTGGGATLFHPENEIVVVHLPSLQSRSFGSRKHVNDRGRAGQPGPYSYVIPLMGPDLFRFCGRARLSWANEGRSSLLSYGPCAGLSRPPGPHLALPFETFGLFPDAEMPCSRLEL